MLLEETIESGMRIKARHKFNVGNLHLRVVGK